MLPFKIKISDKQINEILKRVENYPWHEMPDDGGWEYGTNLYFMREFCDYWVNKYDWRKEEKKINQFTHYKSESDQIKLHFILEKGSGPNPLPLIISHGWPGSFHEILGIINPLAHPEKFGGNEENAFDIIVPSLPGFGFSSRPPRPYGPRKMAEVLNTLMTKNLGYKNYFAHGGDWGSAISSWLGYDFPKFCNGIHITFPTMRHVDGPKTDEEIEWEKKCETKPSISSQNGYRIIQATKPQTLSYSMIDSPVGVAAWIIEKYHAWSDITDDNIESAHNKDDIITNIMIYLLTKTFNTASWIYYGRSEEGGRILGTKDNPRVSVPTAAAIFPADSFPWPPYSYANRLYNIQQWSVMPHGGHFGSLETPELLVEDIREFGRKFRTK